MQKYYTFSSYSFILILIVLLQSLTVLSQKITESVPAVSSPLYQCWDLSLEGINKAEIASDNVNQVFASYQEGVVGAFNLNDGNQNWKSELGGNILSINYRDGILYVVSLNETKNILSLRSLSAETGIAKWQTSLTIDSLQEFNSNRVSFLQTGEFLFIITPTGYLYKFSKEDGKELEKINFGENITTRAELTNQTVLVGTDKKNLIIYSLTGKEIKKISLREIPAVVYVESARVITGDKLGTLASFKSMTNRKEWQTRLGAEVSDITLTKEGLAVSSNDNFIYLISPKNGEKIWKKRFSGRTATDISNNSGNLMVTVNLNSNVSVLLDVRSGKIVNQITLPGSEFFISKPLITKNSIVFKTNAGLTLYSSNEACSKN
jgi:outer membrane protein assembly factor BamB